MNTRLFRSPFRGQKKTFLVLSRKEIEQRSFEQPHLIVSITTIDGSSPQLGSGGSCAGVLGLQFDDVEVAHRGVPMTSAQAREIAEFVRARLDQVELLVVQCDAGISRSAGVAAALSYWIEGTDQFFFDHYVPNRHVRRQLLEALLAGETASDEPE
jgi:predicted protein tyrosine phosphatase